MKALRNSEKSTQNVSGNVVPCWWPVGPDEDFDLAVVDAGGLLTLHHGKGCLNKCRQHLKELLGRCAQLHNTVVRTELERLVAKVNSDAKVFSDRNGHDTADAFVHCVRDVENYARRACQQVTQSHQPDSSMQERVESWPPLPNATVRPPTIVDAGSSRGQPNEMMAFPPERSHWPNEEVENENQQQRRWGLRGTVPQEENGDQSSELMGAMSQMSVPGSDMASQQATSMGTAPQMSAVVSDRAHEVVEPGDADFEVEYDADSGAGPEPGLEALDENDENGTLSIFIAFFGEI